MESCCYTDFVPFLYDADHRGKMQMFWKMVLDSYKVLCFLSSLESDEGLITLGEDGGESPDVEKFRPSVAG